LSDSTVNNLYGRVKTISDYVASRFIHGATLHIQIPVHSNLVKHCAQTSMMLCELLEASRFYLLIIRPYMHLRIVEAAQDLPLAASLLTKAMEWKTIIEEKDDRILQDLVTVLNSKWSETTLVGNLSEDPFQYLLANSKSETNCRRSPDHQPVPFPNTSGSNKC
jgi:hypothetical protein